VSVVANVAINVDSSGAVSKLRQVQQGAQATSQAVDKLNATTAAAGAASAGAASQFQAAANGMRAQQGAAGSLLSSIGRLTSAYLSLRVAQQAVQAGIKREESERRLTFLAQGYNEVARAQTLASQSGKRFGLSATESNQQFAQLYGRLRPLNISLEDINAAFVGFNTAAKVSGTSTAETAGALLQLTQALGSGVLRGQELNSVLEQAPGLVVALTKQLGVPVSTLRKLAEEGKITSDVVINALKRAGVEGAGQLEAALKGPAQSVKNLQNSFEDFQISLTNDVIPAVVELLKVTTSILGAFNKLPGPVKTITAVVFGLVAAFVALAPAISATIGLLGGLSLATLAAAGPWIALAAGVTAAAVALAGYRTESEKIGAKAAAGDPAAMAAARNRITKKEQEVAALKAQRPSPRSARGGDLARAQGELAQLKRDVATGQTAAATPTPTPTPTTATGTGTGKGTGAKKGSDDAAREAQRVADVVRDQQFITKQKGIQTKFAQLIFDAEQSADPIRVRQLQTVEALVLAGNETARLLEEEENSVARLAIARTRQGEAEAIRQEGLQDVLKLQIEQKKNFDEIIAGLDLELALKTATTEQAREQLRLEAEIAKLKGQGFTPEQIGAITAKKTELAAPKTDQQNIADKIGKLKDEIADLTSISNIAITAAEGIGNAFAQSFQGLISGTMTAKEALGSFFKSVADMFLEMAAQIIAKQITMIILQTILKALGGAPGGGGGGFTASGAGFGGTNSFGSFDAGGAAAFGGGMSFAGGGYTGNAPRVGGIDGQGGFPAILHPQETVVDHSGLRSAMGGRPGGANGSPVLNMSFQSSTINGVEYVSRDQLEQAMAQTRREASRDGANRGMTMTLDKLQQSPSTRSRVGMR
jgi:tape measure domain-containing protein